MWQFPRIIQVLNPKSRVSRTLLYCALAACAFAANGYPIRLSNGADMLAGTFFALLAAMTGGIPAAILVSVIGGLRTYLMWGHFWAIPIMVFEAVFVAWHARTHRTPVASILLYWTLIGIPLVVVIYRFHLGVGVNFVWMISLADVLSGILGAIGVHILLSLARMQRWSVVVGIRQFSFSLRSHIWICALLFGIVPLLFLLEYAGRQLALTREREAQTRLQETAEDFEREIRLARRDAGDRQLAGVREEPPSTLRLQWTKGAGDPGLETSLSLEESGWGGRRRSQPLLRLLGFSATGSLLFVYPEESRPDAETLQNIRNGMAAADGPTFSFQRRQTLRFTQSRYIAAIAKSRENGVTIVATQPASFAGREAATLRDVALAWLTGTILMSMIVGAWFSVRITESLQSLVNAMRGAASKDGMIGDCPPSAPPEVRLLWSGVQHMQQKLAEALADQRAKAREAMLTVREKSAFMAAVSHEIRGPMHSILGAATLMGEGTPEMESGQAAQMILRSSRHLISILDDIGDFSRLEAHTMRIRPTRFALATALTELLTWVRSEAKSKNIEIGLEIAADVPFFVFTDRIRLVQILFNLIQNSVKFTDEGQVRLTVVNRKGPPSMVEFRVDDTGEGIPKQFQEMVFEPFFQRAEHPANPKTGSGLGLAIVKRLVTAMHGTVSLASEPGQGTTVCVSLPIAHDADQSAAPLPLAGQLGIFAMGHSMARETLTSQWIYLGGESRHIVFEDWEQWTGVQGATIFLDQDELPEDEIESEQMLRVLTAKGARRVIVVEAFPKAGDEKRNELPVVEIPVESIAWPPVLYAAPSIVRLLLQATRATQGEEEKEQSAEGRTLRILIAEDNDDARMLLELALRKLGHSVSAVADGTAVMSRLHEGEYDFVLLDIEMPTLGGMGVIELIRKDPVTQGLPVYAVTAHSSDTQRAEFLAAGFTGHLPKPFTLTQLDEVLRSRPASAPVMAVSGDLIDELILQQYLDLLKNAGKAAAPSIGRILAEVSAWIQTKPTQHEREASGLHRLCGSSSLIGAKKLSTRLRRVHVLCLGTSVEEWDTAVNDVADVLAETLRYFREKLQISEAALTDAARAGGR